MIKQGRGEMIYHYTSIETLALILESQVLRFNRLDRVRDLSEARTSAGIHFGQVFFVSCWTAEETESIPLWEMSGDRCCGVRVGLPSYPFAEYELDPPPEWNFTKGGRLVSPIPLGEIFAGSHLIVTQFLNRREFGGSVRYVDDVQAEYDSAVSWQPLPGNSVKLKVLDPFGLARLKGSAWRFEAEHRFVLLILPGIPIPSEGPGCPKYASDIANHIVTCLRSGKGPNLDHFDVRLARDAIDRMVVTLGPCVTTGNALVVQSLLEQYAPAARILKSSLAGSIRCR
jgi:hypothetical protein